MFHLGFPVERAPLQCKEALLREGDVVSVLGRISTEVHPAGQRESPRGLPLRRIIRGQSDDPVIVSTGR
jgi:hypothetical protein